MDNLQALLTALVDNIALQYVSPYGEGKRWSKAQLDKFVAGDAGVKWDFKASPHRRNGTDVRLTEKASKFALLFSGQLAAVREGDPVCTLSSAFLSALGVQCDVLYEFTASQRFSTEFVVFHFMYCCRSVFEGHHFDVHHGTLFLSVGAGLGDALSCP